MLKLRFNKYILLSSNFTRLVRVLKMINSQLTIQKEINFKK